MEFQRGFFGHSYLSVDLTDPPDCTARITRLAMMAIADEGFLKAT
jgi:hypothetical protein